MFRGISILGAAAAGALLTFFLDPDQGRRRRAIARDKLASGMSRAGEASDAMARDLQHRTRGLTAGLRRRLSREPVADDVLAERVRARIGRAVSHPGSIEVRVAQGEVTLEGPVLRSEVRRLLRAARAVPGVREVVDRLEQHESAGNVPGLQG